MTSRRPAVGPLLRVWLRVVGEAALRRALPVWTGVAVVSAVVFGGTGMQPGSLTSSALESWRFGLGLTLTWVVLVVPAGRAMLDPAATAYLRALPVARWRRTTVTVAVAVLVQAPWTLLWALGAGAAAAIAATAAATAAMLGLAELAGRLRWPHRAPRWGGALAAVLGAHRRLLLRGRGAALVRAVGIAWLGGAAAGLVARANQLAGDEVLWWTLAVASLALPMAIGALALPVVDADRRMAWLLRASGCSWPVRVLGAGLVLGGLGGGLGAVLAAAAWVVGEPTAATGAGVAGWLTLLGAGIGGLALRAGSWAAAAGDGGRVVVAMAGAAISGFVAIGVLGAAGAVAMAAAGAGAAVALAARPVEVAP